MAGDKSSIYIMDNADNIIKTFYIGKMRYWASLFSLQRYKYRDDSLSLIQNTNGTYYHLKRKAEGRETYSVLHMKTVNEIRGILRDNVPMGQEEEEAKEDMQGVLDFIDEHADIIHENNYNIVFYTDHAF